MLELGIMRPSSSISKCVLGVPQLGHRASAQGIHPLEDKVVATRIFWGIHLSASSVNVLDLSISITVSSPTVLPCSTTSSLIRDLTHGNFSGTSKLPQHSRQSKRHSLNLLFYLTPQVSPYGCMVALLKSCFLCFFLYTYIACAVQFSCALGMFAL